LCAFVLRHDQLLGSSNGKCEKLDFSRVIEKEKGRRDLRIDAKGQL
jgi:hypothetical protein